eukprot:scaffold2115_cov363-Pavlova_lutheri.AAC.5
MEGVDLQCVKPSRVASNKTWSSRGLLRVFPSTCPLENPPIAQERYEGFSMPGFLAPKIAIVPWGSSSLA